MQKKFIMLGMVVGSFAGSYIPLIWGDSAFSMSSIFFGVVGGIFGIWAGNKIANSFYRPRATFLCPILQLHFFPVEFPSVFL